MGPVGRDWYICIYIYIHISTLPTSPEYHIYIYIFGYTVPFTDWPTSEYCAEKHRAARRMRIDRYIFMSDMNNALCNGALPRGGEGARRQQFAQIHINSIITARLAKL